MALKLKFRGKKRVVGNSWMVTIPKGIADILKENQEYDFIIEENDSEVTP